MEVDEKKKHADSESGSDAMEAPAAWTGGLPKSAAYSPGPVKGCGDHPPTKPPPLGFAYY